MRFSFLFRFTALYPILFLRFSAYPILLPLYLAHFKTRDKDDNPQRKATLFFISARTKKLPFFRHPTLSHLTLSIPFLRVLSRQSPCRARKQEQNLKFLAFGMKFPAPFSTYSGKIEVSSTISEADLMLEILQR